MISISIQHLDVYLLDAGSQSSAAIRKTYYSCVVLYRSVRATATRYTCNSNSTGVLVALFCRQGLFMLFVLLTPPPLVPHVFSGMAGKHGCMCAYLRMHVRVLKHLLLPKKPGEERERREGTGTSIMFRRRGFAQPIMQICS